MTNRRTFLTVLGCGLLAAPFAAEAQQAGRVYRIGYLSPSMPAPSLGATSSEHLLSSSLRDLGYVEGRNLVIERQFAEGEIARLPGLAGDLVQHRVDVIVAVANSAILAAKEATTTIPIVMGFGSEPVERGFVMSFARPGGNVTGVTLVADTTLAAKRLELLREAVPSATRIAVLTTDEIAAARLGVRLVVAKVRAHDYERAFATMVAGRGRRMGGQPCGVLALQPLVRAHEPLQQVQELAGLLCHDATVEFPRATPGIPRVVGLIALPAYPTLPHDDLPEALAFQVLAPLARSAAVHPILGS
jgi:hypothetical protein